MKVNGGFLGMDLSAIGMRIQRKKMNLVAENIASADSLRGADGKPYKRKFLEVVSKNGGLLSESGEKIGGGFIPLKVTNPGHISQPSLSLNKENKELDGVDMEVEVDNSQGELEYMPEHPDADANGYVEMSNVSVVQEMVEMINATRSFEANVTAFNSSKQIAKDSLEI